MRLLSFIVLVLLLTACHKTTKKSNITSIEFASGGCQGPCRRIAISIDSSLRYSFYGGATPDNDQLRPGKVAYLKKGCYKGKITESFWDTLTAHLEGVNFEKIDAENDHVSDGEDLEIIIHYNNKIKHIRDSTPSLPANVESVFREIENSYKEIDLKPVKQAIKFETTFQKGDSRLVSNSIDSAKKLKTFLYAYNTKNLKINNKGIQEIFVEKPYTINDFGKCYADENYYQLVVVFKNNTSANGPLINYNVNWDLKIDNLYPEYQNATSMFKENNFVVTFPKHLVDFSDKLKLTVTTNIHRPAESSLLQNIPDNYKGHEISKNIVLYKVK